MKTREAIYSAGNQLNINDWSKYGIIAHWDHASNATYIGSRQRDISYLVQWDHMQFITEALDFLPNASKAERFTPALSNRSVLYSMY